MFKTLNSFLKNIVLLIKNNFYSKVYSIPNAFQGLANYMSGKLIERNSYPSYAELNAVTLNLFFAFAKAMADKQGLSRT
jgi:hypothetical protein